MKTSRFNEGQIIKAIKVRAVFLKLNTRNPRTPTAMVRRRVAMCG
jgi:hypothetical protein